MSTPDQLNAIAQQAFGAALKRIEAKLDALIKALAEDEQEALTDLEGQQHGGERDGRESLG